MARPRIDFGCTLIVIFLVSSIIAMPFIFNEGRLSPLLIILLAIAIGSVCGFVVYFFSLGARREKERR